MPRDDEIQVVWDLIAQEYIVRLSPRVAHVLIWGGYAYCAGKG